MAIDKGLYQAPGGLTPADDELEAEIRIASDPNGVSFRQTDDGGVEITFEDDETEPTAQNAPFNANLAEYLEEGELAALGKTILSEVEADIQSRKDWVDAYVEGMEVLGLRYEEQTDPWAGACGAFSSLLLEAVMRFQAETMGETFPAAGPVRTKILGEETPEKAEAAKRVEHDMNYELTEVMTEYRPEHERMLFSLGLGGAAFKKVYFDPNLGRQTSLYIPAEDVIVPFTASTIEHAERVTHVMRKTKNELLKLQAAGFYLDVNLGEPEPWHSDIDEKKAEIGGFELNDDNRYTFFEVHVEAVIEGINDGTKLDEDREIACPYVITIDRGTGKVLAIRRNWEKLDPLKRKRQFFVKYGYLPGLGFYDLGLIHIVGGYAKATTALIRQLVDAGTLANLQGGFKTKGLRIEGDNDPIAAGEWKDVHVGSGTLRDNIMPLPYKEPSSTLLALLDKLMDEGRRLGSISDLNIADMSANAPVGTTLALLERSLKSMSAVQARVHYSMKQEFKLLHKLIARYAPKEYGYVPDRAGPRARKSDYELVEVIPVSDPNSSTMAQRVVKLQAVHQMAQTAPQIYNLPQLHRQMIEEFGVKNAEKLVPTEDDHEPLDPVSENMNVLMNKPLKAFMHQDHGAHLAAHTAFIQDPMIMQSLGQNPMAQQMMAALQAHIAEHMAYNYRKQMEEKIGAPLPIPNKQLPEEVEVQLSRMMGQAGQQLTQVHRQQAAQKQAEAQAKDPVFQLKEREAAAKEMEIQRKAAKDQMDKDVAEKKIAADLIKADKASKDKQQDRAARRAETNDRLQGEVKKEILRSALQPKTPPTQGSES